MKSLISILFLFCFPLAINSATPIEFQKVVNRNGETIFEVLDGNKIKLQNNYRPKHPTLKLSLHGAQITVISNTTAENWKLTLDDGTTIQLFENESANPFLGTHYYFHWNGGGKNDNREVCFHYGNLEAYWYSTYHSYSSAWPMDASLKLPQSSFNNLFETDKFTFILEHIFLNSQGFALLLDEYAPWFIRRDPNVGDPILCFSVNNTLPYMVENASYKDIKLYLFTATNIQTVTDYVVHHSGYIPKPTTLPSTEKFTSFTSFLLADKQNEIIDFANHLEQHGLTGTEIILSGGWENPRGDLHFNVPNFPNVDQMVSDLYQRHFHLTLEVYPKQTHLHSRTEKYFARNNANNVTNYVDFTRNDSAEWYLTFLKQLRYEYDIYSFMPFYPETEHLKLNDAKYPNNYFKNYIETVSKAGNLTSWLAFKSQHLPIFLQLNFENVLYNSELLKTIISNALSVSVSGYSFFLPSRINPFDKANKEQEELYIRCLQLSALMPGFGVGYLNFDYDERVFDLMKKFINLHLEYAPLIIELAKKRIETGSPIIRPLWYGTPEDSRTFAIADQFLLGENILVAPVVTVGQRTRSVYFPFGTWIDQHGVEFTGLQEHQVDTPLEDLAFFKRKHVVV